MFATPLRKILASFLLCSLVVLLFVAISWWWQTRPLPVTTLSEQESRKIEQQVQPLIDEVKAGNPISTHTIRLTERELNGYLSQHQKLAGKVYFTLNEGYLTAKVVEVLPANSPILAGKKIRLSCEIYFEQGTNGLELIVKNIECFGFSAPDSFTSQYLDKNLLPQLLSKLAITDHYSEHTIITVNKAHITLIFSQ